MKDKWENASQVRRLREHPSADFFIKGRCRVAVLKSLVPLLLAVLTEPVDLNARIGRSEAVLL